MNLKEDVYRMLKRKVYTDLPLDVMLTNKGIEVVIKALNSRK